jgi:LysM repeat protein
MERDRRVAPLIGWLGLLVGVLGAMLLAGDGALAAPPLARPGDWGAWASSRGGPAAALAVVRLVVAGTAGWLLVATVVMSVAQGSGRRSLAIVEVLDVLTVPLVRRVVQGALGVGLVGATVAGAAGHGGHPPSRPAAVAVEAPVLERVGERSPGSTASTTSTTSTIRPTTTTTTSTSTTSTSTTVPPPAQVPDLTGPMASVAADLVAVDAPPPVAAPLAPPPSTWTVASGDHFWSIAERMTGGSGVGVDERVVRGYWSELIAVNRDRLADPGNPDLLFAGDVLVLPPVPSAP